MERVFSDVLVGDKLYYVDLNGNLTYHQIRSIDTCGEHYVHFRDTNGAFFSVPKKDYNKAHGYGNCFSSFYHAQKLAKSRKKVILRKQILHYEDQIKICESKITSLEKELQSLS